MLSINKDKKKKKNFENLNPSEPVKVTQEVFYQMGKLMPALESHSYLLAVPLLPVNLLGIKSIQKSLQLQMSASDEQISCLWKGIQLRKR